MCLEKLLICRGGLFTDFNNLPVYVFHSFVLWQPFFYKKLLDKGGIVFLGRPWINRKLAGVLFDVFIKKLLNKGGIVFLGRP